ncbi:hypothetical protein Ahy_B01g054944 [Arachis hypogaea]|uniref:Uncharacterized protein n=1 Tax=Arachis hypogaea TaxID=3818 RepID=A0A445AUP8_ARAHY|nr:hypothetical protein Ahy_B01g054944 [Arachis hypogaea]
MYITSSSRSNFFPSNQSLTPINFLFLIPSNGFILLTSFIKEPGSLGAANNKLLNLQFDGRRVGFLQGFGTKSWISRKPVQHTTLVMQQQSVKSLTASTAQSIEIQ